ncbi:MAG: nitrogen fixation protein NifM [Gammaproteobacteria bacterium]
MSHSDIEPYALLRSALALFQKAPRDLNDQERAQAAIQAIKECEIESRVLNSPEAAGVIISDRALEKAVEEIRGRFSDESGFSEELELNGLCIDSLKKALLRQCKVESILERVSARACDVSDVEVGIFYHLHPEKFHIPERRSARHILVTVNPDFPENSRENAWRKINDIAETLSRKPQKFAELAMKHSECPTALQGGELGAVSRGTLFPEIEAELFKLKEGRVSGVIETEAGFHIVQCCKIHTAESVSFKKAQPKIRKLMQERLRRKCQRAWLAGLPAASATNYTNN